MIFDMFIIVFLFMYYRTLIVVVIQIRMQIQIQIQIQIQVYTNIVASHGLIIADNECDFNACNLFESASLCFM